MQVSVIETDRLEWTPDRKKDPILKDISITFTQGEIYGILGSNGAGKTSLVRHILSLLPHRDGAVKINGTSMEEFDRKEIATEISFLPQVFATDIEFTVYDVVSMGREPYRKPFSSLTNRDHEMIDEALRLTNCTELAEKKLSTLSGGERQRVMIARTIAQDTPWIILDEPISSLDIKQQTEFMQTMQSLNREKGRTIIAILHDLNMAADYCTQLILMKHGEVVISGATEDVMTPENLERTFDVKFRFMNMPDRRLPYVFPESGNKISQDFYKNTK